MSDALLVDATYEGETRIVAVENGRIQELYYEIGDHDPIVGNVCLAIIERVEPGLEAAFVDYGASRHGFLSLRQVHPSYYSKASEVKGSNRCLGNTALTATGAPETIDEIVIGSQQFSGSILDLMDYANDFAQLGLTDRKAFAPTRERDPGRKAGKSRNRTRKSETLPRIEDVLHPGQVVLVQISKDEVNAKGAALTTFISLPGRYCVLLPLSGRGCEISKKITDRKTRTELEAIYESLVVPENAGVIMRSVMSKPDKDKITADFDYLMTQWTAIQEKVARLRAPCLVHSDGTIIHRILRDLDTRLIDRILVDGKAGFEQTRSAVADMMPEIVDMVEPHEGSRPLFVEEEIDQQLFMLQQSRVDLRSGGQIVIEQTEAMVSIDVNSAKASQGTTVEETALQTNVEAAVEIARQLRLRDLAGIIVIDFIDMNEQRHRNEVKRVLGREMLRDRSKVSMMDISPLGLLEMSRQRLRKSIGSVMTNSCTHCGGTGRIANDGMLALTILRQIEGECSKPKTGHVIANVSVGVGNVLINKKRTEINRIENQYNCTVVIASHADLAVENYDIEVFRDRAGKLLRRVDAKTLLGSHRGRGGAGRRTRDVRNSRSRRTAPMPTSDERPAAGNGKDPAATAAPRSADEEENHAKQGKGADRKRKGPRRKRAASGSAARTPKTLVGNHVAGDDSPLTDHPIHDLKEFEALLPG